MIWARFLGVLACLSKTVSDYQPFHPKIHPPSSSRVFGTFHAIWLNFGGSFLPYPYYKLTDGRSYSTFGSWLQLSFSELVCKTRFSGPKWRFSARPVLGHKNSKFRQVCLKKVVAKTQKYQKHKNLTENCPSSGRKLPPKLSHIA